MIYNLTIDTNSNKVTCTCIGFLTHGYCKHTRIYKPLISKKLYGDPFIEHFIQSFNNCYDFVINLCDQYPECKGDYDILDNISKQVLEGIGKHYCTETIHRCYRKAVENREILEPINHQVRKEKTEQVMHDINRWSPTGFVDFKNGQTSLTNGDDLD